MEQLHAHEVLHMMEGNSYSESSLREAIIKKFGSQQRFYACSAENMDVDTLIEFLKMKGNLCLLKMDSPWISLKFASIDVWMVSGNPVLEDK